MLTFVRSSSSVLVMISSMAVPICNHLYARQANRVYCINLCKKNCSVYIQCKGDIMVVDIKQHKSQLKNSNFTITQSAKFSDIV